jgi:hypothetical protein
LDLSLLVEEKGAIVETFETSVGSASSLNGTGNSREGHAEGRETHYETYAQQGNLQEEKRVNGISSKPLSWAERTGSI